MWKWVVNKSQTYSLCYLPIKRVLKRNIKLSRERDVEFSKDLKRFVPCRLLLISASDGDLDMLIVKKTGDRKSGLWSFFSPRTSHLTRFSLSFDD